MSYGLNAPEQKDGYLLYQPIGGTKGSEAQIAIGTDFFFVGGAKPSDRGPIIEKFMTVMGPVYYPRRMSLSSPTNKSHDLSMWFGGDPILETLGSQIGNANLDTLKGGND